MNYNFSSDQQLAWESCLSFLQKPSGGMFLIDGAAGTGKTFLVCKIVEALKSNEILLMAPTHKAVKVLIKHSNVTFRTVKFATVHSALGLREHIDGYGVQSFVKDKTHEDIFQQKKYKYAFIDEASMLHDDLFEYLVAHMKTIGTKIIFIGDSVQIPPVNGLNAKPFDKNIQQKYDIKVATLKEIIRQSSGSPIIELATHIRNNIESKNPMIEKNKASTSGCVKFIEPTEQNKILTSLYRSKEFKTDTDFVRVVAWTNYRVNMYNSLIRKIIFRGMNLKKLMRNEKIIIESPVIVRDRVVLNTNDEVEVINFKLEEESVNNGQFILKYYLTLVEYDTLFFGKIQHWLKIIHEDSESEFNKICGYLLEIAKEEKQGTDKAKMAWIQYYNFKGYFTTFKYCYAITAHKSQGSTYENCIVCAPDILTNKNIVERNRILYTACTRPSKNLYII